MKTFALTLVLTTTFAAAGTRAAAVTDLAAVKALYAAAEYDEALKLLARPDPTDDVIVVEEYRALCLLALGRAADAERSIERILRRQPTYAVDAAQVSPRMVSLVLDMRQRTLPLIARDLYGLARKSFEQKDYATTIGQLRQMQVVVEAAGPKADLADLKLLGEGFLRLAEAQVVAASAPAPPVSTPTPAAAPVALRPDVYSEADKVTPPVVVVREMPPWAPADPVARRMTHRGHLEIVVDEKGSVEEAIVREPIADGYDAALLTAARLWRYRPALRNGQPVKYRLLIEILLGPPRQ